MSLRQYKTQAAKCSGPQPASVLFTRLLHCEPGFNSCSSRESNEPKQANPLVLDFFAASAPCPSTPPSTNQVVAQSRRDPVRLPAAADRGTRHPKPGTTFNVTATQPADAARISLFVGAITKMFQYIFVDLESHRAWRALIHRAQIASHRRHHTGHPKRWPPPGASAPQDP